MTILEIWCYWIKRSYCDKPEFKFQLSIILYKLVQWFMAFFQKNGWVCTVDNDKSLSSLILGLFQLCFVLQIKQSFSFKKTKVVANVIMNIKTKNTFSTLIKKVRKIWKLKDEIKILSKLLKIWTQHRTVKSCIMTSSKMWLLPY